MSARALSSHPGVEVLGAGTLLGALLLTVIKTGSTHVGLPNWVQEILTGVIIVAAMGLDRLRQCAR